MRPDTGERLRGALNGRQADQEKLCVALLPALGNYSNVCPRRPEGGPDGGRDIEAILGGAIVTWGAVGFRNNAGSSSLDRGWANRKFRADLDRALKENPALQGFVFFTNVDLTPSQVAELKQHAHERKVAYVDIFDFQRLRDALDRPSGFIARLQYLDIEISKDEQLGLIHTSGQELQKTLNSGFSRIDKTLERMEKFLDVRRPLHRIALIFTLDQPLADITASPQAVATYVQGLWPASRDRLVLLARAQQQTREDAVVAGLESWIVHVAKAGEASIDPDRHLRFRSTRSQVDMCIVGNYEFSFAAGGGSLHFADVTAVGASVFASPAVAPHIVRLQLDMNGYTVIGRDRMYEAVSAPAPPSVPEELRQEDLRHVLTCHELISLDGLRRSSLSFT